METQASLVRADCAVELHAVAGVGLHLSVVVNPGDTEGEDAVRFDHSLHNLGTFEFRMLIVNLLYRFENFLHCLKVLVLPRILGLEL